MTPPLGKYEKCLIEAATGKAEGAAFAWNKLAYEQPPNEWPAAWQRLLPSIWANLKDRPAQDLVYRDRLAKFYQTSWGGNIRLRQEICEVVSLLNQAAIPSILLKGLWLELSAELELGSRPTADIDLLIPFHLVKDAFRALQEHGWKPELSTQVNPTDRLTHATEFYKNGVGLDLHWFLLPECRTPGCDDIFWERAETQNMGGTAICGLNPTHLFFHLAVLAEREPDQRIRYYHDLQQIWSRHQENISIQEVVRLLKERHLLSRGLPAICSVAGKVTSPTPDLLDRLWSKSTQAVYDNSHELYYGLFPVLDYWLHFRDRASGWSFTTYLQRRLKIQGPRDLVSRSIRKLIRMAGG